jgi:hypothetical protein
MLTSFRRNQRISRKEKTLNLYILGLLQILPDRLHFGLYHFHIQRNLRGNQTEVSVCYKDTVCRNSVISNITNDWPVMSRVGVTIDEVYIGNWIY